MATRPVDEKIVVMKLDNSDLQSKAIETTSIFGKLKSVFNTAGDTNLKNVTNDLGGIQKAADRVSMNVLASAVDNISSRFSTMGVVATTALTNITNKAVNAGMALQKSLTTDQISSGFKEYETKIGSIQTILANTQRDGTTLDDVSKSLNELNDYADQTIYSFGEMTKNIGLFTNAGLKLEESTSMIKGFSNAAAASGTNAEGAARAAYQLSQGLSQGYIMQMDWMSLTSAGMGNDNMKRDLIAIGQAMGTLDKQTEFTMTNWKDLLSKDKWLTSDVMSTYLQAMAGDLDKTTLMTQGLTEAQADMLIQNAKTGEESATMVRTFTQLMGGLKESIGSGWSESFELIFGDFEQATRLWSSVSALVGGFFQRQSDARNNFIRSLIDSGALEKFGEVIRNVGTPLVQLFTSIGSAFKSIFPPVESTGLVSFLSTVSNLTVSLKMNASTVENVKTIFSGLFSSVSIVVQVFKILTGAILGLIPGFNGAGGGITSLLAKFAQLPIALNNYLKSGDLAERITDKLRSVFGGLGTVLSVIGSAFTNLASIIGQTSSILSSGVFTGGAIDEKSPIVDFLFGMRDAFKDVFGFISAVDYSAIWAGIGSFFEGIGDTFVWFKDKTISVVEFFKNLPQLIGDNQGWLLAGGGIAAMSTIIWKVYEVFTSITKSFSGVGDVIDGVGDSLGAFTLGIHAKSLLAIALAVGVLAVSLSILAKLDGKQIATSLTAVVVSISALVGALAVISKAGLTADVGAIMTIIALSVAVALLAGAVVKLGEIDANEATQGVLALTALLGGLSAAITLMSKYGGTFTVGAAQFLAIATAITVMVYAINQIAEIDTSDLFVGLTTIGIILLELAVFVRLASTVNTQLAASAAGLIATAGAVLIMVMAIKSISTIAPNDLVIGLTTIGLILGAIAAFSVVVSKANMLVVGAGLVLLATAINMLVVPILALGNAPLEVLAKGLGAIGLALAAFALTSQFMVATIPAAIAIGLLAVALNLLIIPIMAMGAMTWTTILTGIGGLALALLAFGAVAAILGLASPALIAFSIAIVAVGVGMLALGSGMSLLAKSFLIMSTMTVGAITVMVTAFAAFITGLTALLPAITDLVMKVIDAMLEVMVKMAPKVADAAGRLILVILDKIAEYAPKILDSVGEIILLILGKIVEYVPQFLEAVGDLLIALLEVIAEFIPKAIEVVLDLLLDLLDTIEEYVPKFVKAGADIIVAILDGLSEDVPRVVESMSEFVLTMVTTMTETFRTNGPEFTNAVMELMGEVVSIMVTAGLSVIQALFGWLPGVTEATTAIGKTAGKYIDDNFKAKDIGTQKGTDFSGGLSSTNGTIQTAGMSLANSGVTGIQSVDTADAGVNFAQGFANGIGDKSVLSKTIGAAKGLASSAYTTIKKWLDIRSPSGETTLLGEHTGQGFANGIATKGKSVFEALLGWETPAAKATDKVSKTIETKSEVAGSNSVKAMTKGVKKGVKTNKKSAEDSAKELADAIKKAFEEKMDNVEYKFKMGDINADQRIAQLKKIRDEYAKHPELFKKVNLEIKKSEDDLVKSKTEALKKEFDAAKKVIDDKKYYNELSMKQELDSWVKIRTEYKKDVELRKEADKEIYRIRKEMNDKLTETNKEYVDSVVETNQDLIDSATELDDKYNETFDQRKSDLTNFAGLFDEISKDSEVTALQLVTNLTDQVSAFKTWQDQITKLSSKAINDGLLAELREMGPKALHEIQLLNSMSETELKRYSDLYAEKSKLATEEAEKELAPMKANTEKQIEDLRVASTKKLDQLKIDWISKIGEITGGTETQLKGLNSIGSDAVLGLIMGMNSRKGELEAVSREIGAIVDEAVRKQLKIKSPSRVMMAIGGYVVDGLMVGIDDKTPEAISKIKELADKITTAFETGTAANIPFINLIGDGMDMETRKFLSEYDNLMVDSAIASEERRLEIIKSYADRRKEISLAHYNLDTEELKKEFILLGQEAYLTGEKLEEFANWHVNNRMYNELEQMTEKIRILNEYEFGELDSLDRRRAQVFERQKSFMEQAKQLYNISLQDQHDLYSEFASFYKADSDEYKYFAELKIKTQAELFKKMFDDEKKYVEKRKKYSQLSMSDELKAYEEYIKAYAKGSEERLYYEDKIAESKKAIHDKLNGLNDDYITKISDLNNELIEAELDAANAIADGRRDIDDQMNSDLLSEKEAYNSRVADLNQKLIDDEQYLNDEYSKAVEDRTKSYYDFVGVFDKVEKKSGITGARLLRNLQGQVDTFKKWSSNIAKLSEKGIDQGLLEELRTMGPSAATEIAALNTLSESELQEYSEIWKEKSVSARETAVSELQTMKENTMSKIDELRSETAKQLAIYEEQWDATNKQIVADANARMAQLENDINSKLQLIRTRTADQLKIYQDEWETAINKIKDSTTGVFNAMTEEMPAIGENIIEGLQEGLSNKAPALMAQAQSIADMIAETIRKALDINSPSGITEEIGEWTGQGLVNGIASKVKSVVSASKELAVSAKDSLNKFLDGFEIPDDGNEIHFKAVIDYESFDPSGFGKMDAFSLAPDLSYTNGMVSATRQSTMDRQNIHSSSSTTDNSRNFNPTTIIQSGPSARDIARENNKIMRKMAYEFGV